VNGEVIKENTTLRAKDIITIGQTLLLFIPLCDDEFDWSNPEKINRASGIQEKKYPETTVTSYRIYEPQTTVLTSASVNVQEKAEEKQTWLCPICNAANSVSSGFCQMCGAPRG
jgi:rubrerythrin